MFVPNPSRFGRSDRTYLPHDAPRLSLLVIQDVYFPPVAGLSENPKTTLEPGLGAFVDAYPRIYLFRLGETSPSPGTCHVQLLASSWMSSLGGVGSLFSLKW